MRRHLLQGLLALATVAVLGGCAALNQFSAEVSTFGEWPPGRQPGTYAFERLPSQQAAGDAQQLIEDAVRPALEKAGFRPASTGVEPDVLVQAGARMGRSDRSPWDDPFWWHGGFGYWRHSPWRGPGWGASWRLERARYDREVAVLIRDRSSGKPLYEARASCESMNGSANALGPLYRAALTDFPVAGIKPRQVTVPMTP